MRDVKKEMGIVNSEQAKGLTLNRKVMVMFSIIEPKWEEELTKYRRRSLSGTPKIPIGYDLYSLSINPRA
jgi:hypothetical protein